MIGKRQSPVASKLYRTEGSSTAISNNAEMSYLTMNERSTIFLPEIEFSNVAGDMLAMRSERVKNPFKWDEERRYLLRAELDAAYFNLYGIERDDVDYIMETFPIVKRKDEAKYGEYRTKRMILEIYDEMKVAMESGMAYKTRLDPPPADERVIHSDVHQCGNE